MPAQSITINATCNANTLNLSRSSSSNESNQVFWQGNGNNSYTLTIPGGYFQNQPNEFTLQVPSPPSQSSTLTLNTNAPTGTLTYGIAGPGCSGVGGDPRTGEIIIDP